MKNQKRTMNLKHSRKKRGFITFDLLIGAGIVSFILLLIVAGIPKITYKLNLNALQGDVVSIGNGAVAAKRRAGNFANVTYANMCADEQLDEAICGANPGVAVNPFGGNYGFQPAAANPGLRQVIVTIPSDTDRINDIADTLANMSRDNCLTRTGCATLTVAGNTITVTL